MARRPAWNSKAERARRAAVREQTLSDVASFGEAFDELVPLLSAWVQLQRTLEHHVVTFGHPFQLMASYEGSDGPVIAAREASFVAASYGYVALRAAEFASLTVDRSAVAAGNSGASLNIYLDDAATQVTAIEPGSDESR